MHISKTAWELSNLGFLRVAFTSLIVLAVFAQYAHADIERKIVKWKDDKGVTHYGDSIPAQYANSENSVISKQGITVQRNKPITLQDQVLAIAKLEQAKKNKALLSAFTNENEIDLARDRNLQLDKITLEGLQLQKSNGQKKLKNNQKDADDFTKRGKPISADLSAEIKANQLDIAKQDQQITERKAAMEITRKRFDEDKKRYIALKTPTNLDGIALE